MPDKKIHERHLVEQQDRRGDGPRRDVTGEVFTDSVKALQLQRWHRLVWSVQNDSCNSLRTAGRV